MTPPPVTHLNAPAADEINPDILMTRSGLISGRVLALLTRRGWWPPLWVGRHDPRFRMGGTALRMSMLPVFVMRPHLVRAPTTVRSFRTRPLTEAASGLTRSGHLPRTAHMHWRRSTAP